MQSKDIINLTQTLGDKFLIQKIILTTVESCTGGLLSAQLTNTPGSSTWFDRGFITYSNQSKIDCVKVKKDTIDKYGSVSQQTANEMALGAVNNSQANLGLSITGIAGPGGASKNKPVGLVYIGIKKGNKIIIKENIFKNKNRISIQKATVNISLKMINKII